MINVFSEEGNIIGVCLGSLGLYLVGSNLLQQFKKYAEFFTESSKIKAGTSKKYKLIEGFANKFYSREDGLVKNDIICSLGNSLYVEDFELRGDSIVTLSPSFETEFQAVRNSFLKENSFTQIMMRALFYTKSKVIKDGDKVFAVVTKSPTRRTTPVILSNDQISDFRPIFKLDSLVDLFVDSLITVFLSKIIYHNLSVLARKFSKSVTKFAKQESPYCKHCDSTTDGLFCMSCENISSICSKCFFELKKEFQAGNEVDLYCNICEKLLEEVKIINSAY